MTPEKKRLMWILIAIALFFANLTVGTIYVLKYASMKGAAPQNTSSGPATSGPATQQQ